LHKLAWTRNWSLLGAEVIFVAAVVRLEPVRVIVIIPIEIIVSCKVSSLTAKDAAKTSAKKERM
jgi:hypothetical protein